MDNATWIRSHLCDENLNDRDQLFRINTNKSDFYTDLCKLNDTSLINLVNLTSANIDFTQVKLQVC